MSKLGEYLTMGVLLGSDISPFAIPKKKRHISECGTNQPMGKKHNKTKPHEVYKYKKRKMAKESRKKNR